MKDELIREALPEKECDHFGHWTSGGMSTLNSKEGVIYLAQLVVCSQCGLSKVQIHQIGPAKEEKSEIAKP